jgi:hypothetical protein
MAEHKDDGNMRSFESGATRDTAEDKLDYEGFLSPKVLLQFAKYMNMNRVQSDGNLRDSDNWQKGIPFDAYMKSGYRHFNEWWFLHRCLTARDRDGMIEGIGAICGLMFNAMGYLHELLKEHDVIDFDGDEPTFEMKERLEKIKEDHNVDKPLPDFKCSEFDQCTKCPAYQAGNEQDCLDAQSQEEEQEKQIEHTGFCLGKFDNDTCLMECPASDECLELYEKEMNAVQPVVDRMKELAYAPICYDCDKEECYGCEGLTSSPPCHEISCPDCDYAEICTMTEDEEGDL